MAKENVNQKQYSKAKVHRPKRNKQANLGKIKASNHSPSPSQALLFQFSYVYLGDMIKSITANEKEQRNRERQMRTGQCPGFSSLGVKASEVGLKLTNISDFRDPEYKASTFTRLGMDSSSLWNKSTKPPLIPHSAMREEFKEEQVDLSDGEMMDSQFLTSKASMNEASDLGGYLGLGKFCKPWFIWKL